MTGKDDASQPLPATRHTTDCMTFIDRRRYQQLCESEMPQIEPFLELDALANEDMQTDKTA